MDDYYALIGVPRYSDISTVRAAYLAQIKYFHPDVFQGNPTVAQLKTQQLNEAYSVLKDPVLKTRYDNRMRAMERQEIEHPKTANLHAERTSQTSTAPQQQPSAKKPQAAAKRPFYRTGAFRGVVALLCFCVLLVVGTDWEKLTGETSDQPRTTTVSSQPSPDPTVSFRTFTAPAPIAVQAPANGYIFYENGEDRVAPFSVETQGTGYYYIKLRYVGSKKDALIFFVRGGQSLDIDVPLGNYEMLYAFGSTWYGESLLFGADTVYSKADSTFLFHDDGEYVTGWTVELYLQADGNLDIDTISADEF